MGNAIYVQHPFPVPIMLLLLGLRIAHYGQFNLKESKDHMKITCALSADVP
jgi:hypothetical protein